MCVYYKTDQPKNGGLMNHMNDMGVGLNMYILLWGQNTLPQYVIIQKRAEMDREEYMDILNYFILKSGHPWYSTMHLPEKCPQHEFIKEKESNNNTDCKMNEGV